MKQHHYYVYITTNATKTTLYTGMTNDLPRRLQEHHANRGKSESFAGKYYCHNLVYYEHFKYVVQAISREKEIKGWVRAKKDALITAFNPVWNFLNQEIQE